MSSLISAYQSVEQIQKAANDYIAEGKKDTALELLSNFIIAKRVKQWSQELEDIMVTMIDSAIELKRVTILREPLNNFKSISQYSNIISLDKVLGYFADQSEKLQKEFAPQINEKFLEMEDLDNEDVDELFISSLSNFRSEKANIRESWKNLWDTYKIIIDIIQKNKKLEGLYSRICKKAFDFCKVYKRKIEFKRLSEGMRYNLRNIIKSIDTNPDYSKIPFVIDLEDPETNDEQINIRFELLSYAYFFELWQESFKILTDIHQIMERRKVSAKSKTLSDYFENLANMFWKSDFFHYHAVAYFNHFSIIKTKNKALSTSDLEHKSNYFVLAVLSIPPTTNEQTLSEEARSEAISLMSSEVTIPSRSELVTYIIRHNILDLCLPEIKSLFFLIEESVDVLSLANKSDPFLAKIKESRPQFANQLQTIIIYKILSQLSKLYTKIRIESFTKFIGKLNFAACENIINLSTIHDSIKVKIDHRRQLLVFQDEAKDLRALSSKLVNFSDEVKDLVYTIEENKNEANYAKNLKKLIEDAKNYTSSATNALRDRRNIIEKMKKPDPQWANNKHMRELEEQKLQAEQDKINQQQREIKKMQDEEEERKKRERRKLEELNELRKKALLNELKVKCKGIKIGKKKVEEMTDRDLEATTYDALEQARSNFEKEEKQKEENFIKKTFRKVDYIERAKREEYQTLAKAAWQNGAEKKLEIETTHKSNFETQNTFKKKIASATVYRNNYISEQIKEREEEYKKQIEEFKQKINKDFKAKILEKAQQSLKDKKDQEEAERKKEEEETNKRKNALEENHKKQTEEQKKTLLIRGDKTRQEMQEETKQSNPTNSQPSANNSSTTAPKSGWGRGIDVKKETEPQPQQTTSKGFSRGSDFKKTEPSTTTTTTTTASSSGPSRGFIKRNDTNSQPTTTTTTTTTNTQSQPKPEEKKPSTTTTTSSDGFVTVTKTSGGGAWGRNSKK